jgi:hypothetical protein
MNPLRFLAPPLVLVAAISLAGCASETETPPPPGEVETDTGASLDDLERRTFNFFWELSDPVTGLTPDRWPTKSFSSLAAVGFALTAYPIGAERGYVTRAEAAGRVHNTLTFLWEAPQNDSPSDATGYRGFFYHFVDPETGRRFGNVELSTVDTALLMAGALFCQSYFDGTEPQEEKIRELADALYRRVDWQWAQPRPPTIVLGWKPEEGFLPYDWRGYNEAMIMYLLALGSPTHPVGEEGWEEWVSRYQWNDFHGYEHLGFAPLFGHQFSHVWVDFRGIQDEYMRSRGIDYFENSRLATLSQRAYAIENPSAFAGYGEDLWGLSACDGPVDGEFEIDGVTRSFRTYAGRGASFTHIVDDGTVTPMAATSSIVFAPEVAIPTIISMRDTYGENLYSTYGFLDALNPTLTIDVQVQHGRVIPGTGWFDTDYLGIDQGPILAMVENYRSELVWKTMRRNPYIIEGLRRAGFSGGWLEEAPEAE